MKWFSKKEISELDCKQIQDLLNNANQQLLNSQGLCQEFENRLVPITKLLRKLEQDLKKTNKELLSEAITEVLNVLVK